MGAARHFLKTALADKTDEEKFRVLQPTLEVNAAHPIMKKLYSLKSTNSELARLVAEQVCGGVNLLLYLLIVLSTNFSSVFMFCVKFAISLLSCEFQCKF